MQKFVLQVIQLKSVGLLKLLSCSVVVLPDFMHRLLLLTDQGLERWELYSTKL